MEHLRSHFNDCGTKTKCFIALVASTGLAYTSYVSINNYLRRRRLLELIGQKQRQRDEQIATLRRQLEIGVTPEKLERRREIVELGFEELRLRLQNGQLTAVDALEAFQWRALEAQEKTNFACQFILEARKWAEKLDAKYGNAGTKPPLFGIPYSSKECWFIKGYDCTAGFAQWIGQPVSENSEITEVFRHAGAIPFVTTNIPTSMFSTGCSNLVYGDSTNPYDPQRTVGGSTGGEAAVLALRGSPLGIGGDIGGSVRTPAHCCGITALKPTVGRLLNAHLSRAAAPGITAIKGTLGPMGPDVDSLVWFMRAVCAPESEMFKLDPSVPPMPFNEEVYNGSNRLTIGYYDHDNWITASPACRRAVAVAREVLESKGHRLVPLVFPFSKEEMRDLMEIYVAGIFPDGGKENAVWLARDVVDPAHQHLANFVSWPIWYRKLKSRLTLSRYWSTIYAGCESDTTKLRIKYDNIDHIKDKFFKFWRGNCLDCLICPVVATPALPVDVPPGLFCIYWSYCALYNFMNYTAGSLNCTYVTAVDERNALEETQTNGLDDNDAICKMLRQCQKGSTNLPVGIQVVTLPFRDELCLRVMKEIENGLQKK